MMQIAKRDPVELHEQSEALLGGAWLTMTPAQREQLIRSFCDGYVVPPFSVRPPTVYRAQVNEDRELFPHVSRLLAPPPHVVTNPGRLNRAGEPTLYIAGTAMAAAAETRSGIGAVVSIVACRLREGSEPLTLAPVAMMRLKEAHSTGPLGSILKQGPLGLDAFSTLLRERDCLDQWSLQDHVLGELLVTELSTEDQYALYEMTNEIREHIYRTWPGYDGVYYPSIKAARTAPNAALDAARWGDVEPLEVWVVEVNRELWRRPSGMLTMARPLLKFGRVGDNGHIRYHDTTKTLLTAVQDFKQAYGLIPSDGFQPTLIKPFVRNRISYGSSRDRTRYDFLT